MSIAFVITISALMVWIAFIYNRLVIDKKTVMASWSDIEVQLKRRHDLIPKLLDMVKQYANYEAATLSAILELRNRSETLNKIQEKGATEVELGKKLHDFIALAEDYPELKANQSFMDLQFNLTEVENNIQYARRYYNGAVRRLGIRIESFPDHFIARFFRFLPAEYFDFDETE